MDQLKSVSTILNIYNTIAKVWTHCIGEHQFGLIPIINNFKNQFHKELFDDDFLQTIDGEFSEGFRNIIYLKVDDKYYQSLNYRIILYKSDNHVNKVTCIHPFASDSDITINVYINKEDFLLNIKASKDTYMEAWSELYFLYYDIFIDTLQVLSGRSFGQNNLTSDMYFAQILSLSFTSGLIRLPIEDIFEFINNHPNHFEFIINKFDHINDNETIKLKYKAYLEDILKMQDKTNPTITASVPEFKRIINAFQKIYGIY